MRRLFIFLFYILVSSALFSATAQKEQRKRCTPENGERIDQILERNGLEVDKYQKLFIAINWRRLGANNMLLKDVSYELPTRKDFRNRDEIIKQYEAAKSASNAASANDKAVQERKRVVPLDGEIMDDLLKRNGLDPTKFRAVFADINWARLGSKGMLLKGVSYELPTQHDLNNAASIKKSADDARAQKQKTVAEAKAEKEVLSQPLPKQVTIPILGKNYEKVDIVDDMLRGATFYLVSGHGGPDPGAMADYQSKVISEDEYAYDIILRLARQVISHGAVAHVIIRDPDDGIRDDAVLACDDHETCMGGTIPLEQIKRLGQRADSINSLYDKERAKGYCRAVFIHIDSRSKDERIDIFFYHFMKSVKGERLARVLQKTMTEKYKKHQPNRGFNGTVTSRNLYVLRETNPVGVFLELGNIQNSLDVQRFVIANNREAVARWITEGLIEDFNLEKASWKKSSK